MRSKTKGATALAAGAALAAAAAVWPSSGAAAEPTAEARLDGAIERALHDGGPWFTPGERAVIERLCGYAPGSWDGFDINVSGGVLFCRDGRRVDDPQVRTIMAAAAPRIARRVESAMRRPEVTAGIEAVAREAAAQAMRELAERGDR